MATAAIKALRVKKPLAHIQLITSPQYVDYLKELGIVDSVSAEASPDHTSFIDLDDAYESHLREGTWKHPVHAYGERLGVAVADDSYQIPATEDLTPWAQQLLPKVEGRRYVALAVRSPWRSMASWTERRWIELTRANPDLAFVLLDPLAHPPMEATGDPPEGLRLWEVPNVIDLTGQIPSLRHLSAVLRACQACVSVDTGTAHIASGVGLPLVILFGGAAGWARAPLAGKCRIVQGVAPCYPCRNLGPCPRTDGPHCLSVITADQVNRNLREILA